MVSVRGYGCSSAAGLGVEAFWSALSSGKACQTAAEDPALQTKIGKFHPLDNQAIKSDGLGIDLLNSHLLYAWQELRSKFGKDLNFHEITQNLGVIFASTKGQCEDLVWQTDRKNLEQDTLEPVLREFLQRSELGPKLSVCVSNACSSSHGALYLAKHWLEFGHVDYVLILAADQIGPFISKGFKTLKALAENELRPFDAERTGLLLGEAAAAVLLSRSTADSSSQILLEAVATHAEGSSATRPSELGESLKSCLAALKLVTKDWPDVMIAHGTATKMNDMTEDRVFRDLFTDATAITSAKWCIGHTMGASGAMDLIAACEILKRQEVFPMATCRNLDDDFKGGYLVANSPHHEKPGGVKRVWVSSLGFGGMNAALSLRMNDGVSHVTDPEVRVSHVTDPEVRAQVFKGNFHLPLKEPPAFLSKIDRWYQLDGAALSLTLAYNDWRTMLPVPDRIFLASPSASNETDWEFTQSGGISPAKFVHTLPNVRSTALLQAMNWTGPVLCLQDGRETFLSAVKQAIMTARDLGETVWVAGLYRDHQTIDPTAAINYKVHILAFGNFDQGGQILDCELLQNHVELQKWFKSQGLSFESTDVRN
jgi:3-oxoacyl-[acyl-carrier-protein] synthase-1